MKMRHQGDGEEDQDEWSERRGHGSDRHVGRDTSDHTIRRGIVNSRANIRVTYHWNGNERDHDHNRVNDDRIC